MPLEKKRWPENIGMQKDNYKDWEFARQALRKILREWALTRSAVELRAVLFVYDRTLGWSKEWEVITMEQASFGVWSDDGECWAAPVTKDKARARTVFQGLVNAGHIYRRAKSKTYEYSLNLDDMKVPKRLKNEPDLGVRKRTTEGCENALLNGAKTHPKEYFVKERVTKENRCASASHRAGSPEQSEIETATEIVRTVITASRAKAERRKKQGKFERCANGNQSGFVPFRSALAINWISIHRQVFAEASVAPLSSVSIKILHSYAKNWTLLRESGEFLDYLQWIFENWSVLRSGPFKWMQDFPLTPSIRIIVNAKLRPFIEEAYQQREWWARWSQMDEYERRVHHLSTNKGIDRSRAEEIAKKETGFRDEVKLLKEERRKLELAAMSVKQAYQQERAALRKQHERLGKPRLEDTEGDFGKWEDEQ
jgi:hypothetical protein